MIPLYSEMSSDNPDSKLNCISQQYKLLGANVVVTLLDGKLASVGRRIEQWRRSAVPLLDCSPLDSQGLVRLLLLLTWPGHGAVAAGLQPSSTLGTLQLTPTTVNPDRHFSVTVKDKKL